MDIPVFDITINKDDFMDKMHPIYGKCRKYMGDLDLKYIIDKYNKTYKTINKYIIKSVDKTDRFNIKMKYINYFIGGLVNDINTYLFFEINKLNKLDVYYLDIKCDVDNCVFETSIINTNNKLYFIISDILWYDGCDIKDDISVDKLFNSIKFYTNNFVIDIVDFISIDYLKSYVNNYIELIPYCNFIKGIVLNMKFRDKINGNNFQYIYYLNESDIKPNTMISPQMFELKDNLIIYNNFLGKYVIQKIDNNVRKDIKILCEYDKYKKIWNIVKYL